MTKLVPTPTVIETLAALGVSRETLELLERYVESLVIWQARINLVSPRTLEEIWTRHILDSAQLVVFGKNARIWLDLGSGGGLPGLVVACMVRDISGARVHLVESNRKKASFLQFVGESLGLPVHVHPERIEDCLPRLEQPDVITARALAPLDALIGYTNLLLKRGAVGLFPKGRDHQEELTEAGKHWHFSYQLHQSLTDPEARIIQVMM